VDAFAAAQARAFAILAERAAPVYAALAHGTDPLGASAPAVLGASDFVLDALCSEATLWPLLQARGAVRLAGEPLPLPPLANPGVAQEQSALAALRRWRRCEYARIAWRDLAGWASLDETLGELSRAAGLAVRSALACAESMLNGRHGRPHSQSGVPQPLVIVAMGKLGGEELNFSSDIDLVLLYPEDGTTDGPEPVTNQEYFTKVAHKLVHLLAARTAEGFVFRVDLRLRPFGDSGPVVSSAAALEDYLLIHGRDWERYAWVKARPISAESAYVPLFRATIGPFVYRRYLDFGVLESLREMKALVEREVVRRDLAEDIKLGDGGIREIEFIVQSFQLIRGGQDRRLRGSSLRRALALLAGAKMLPAQAVAELDAAYVFLRRLENRLQMRADQQRHRMPAEESERAILAASMGCAEGAELLRLLDAHRGRVAAHFRAVVFGASTQERTPLHSPSPLPAPLASPWATPLPLANADLDALRTRLAQMNFDDAAAAARLLLDFQHGAVVQRLDSIGARRLGALLPVLAQDAAATAAPLPSLRRLLRVLEAIGGRSAYLSLLLHSVAARRRLVELSTHGDFLIEQIALHPLLLDELIDDRLFDLAPDRAALAADLEQRMAGVDEDDEERLVERLRHFQRAAVFRLAVADLLAHLPVMAVSDRLTELAELIIERALALTWQQLIPRLGLPMCGEGAERRAVRLCVVGYGKLGGKELGYASDLDLVFLHDSGGTHQETIGARSVENPVFFGRFAQRLVHLLTMHSAAGRLYEVDIRLRPSGKSGMLITSIEAFAEYQQREAWTWEHQALLHARAVAGAPELRERFEDVRMQILTRHVRRATLREQVRSMRDRQRRELSRGSVAKQTVDLKQDPGGIGDIEFLAQYWALLWAERYPPVAMFADTIRQLESVASADLVPQARIDLLTAAYRAYRSRLHHRALGGQGAVVPAQEFLAERGAVSAIWNEVMGAEPESGNPADA
jgi:glutamate-ammonia-ligase adenylyltransferase